MDKKIILSLLLLLFLQSIVVAQKEHSDYRTYQVVIDHSISKTKGGPDLSIDSFHYQIKLFRDSTFEYLTYQKTKGGETLDSSIIEGNYVVKRRRIYFIHDQYFKDNTGIKWILKKRHILVKGFSTKRTKLAYKK